MYLLFNFQSYYYLEYFILIHIKINSSKILKSFKVTHPLKITKNYMVTIISYITLLFGALGFTLTIYLGLLKVVKLI
jgi:hypothetical protein